VPSNGELSAAGEADGVGFTSGLIRGGQQPEEGLGSKAPHGRVKMSALRWGNAGGSSGGAAR
jgi:hypothetical protein